jgi:hypothetical protein
MAVMTKALLEGVQDVTITPEMVAAGVDRLAWISTEGN